MKMKTLRQLKNVPLEVIEKWLKDNDWRVRQAAMNACNGREVPLEVIERGLKDNDCDVRQAAMKIASERGMVTRLIDPPEKVYKKCLGGVLVVAEIPNDAHIRGQINGKCRASKAKIVDIIGDFYGEKLAISIYDCNTCYQIGDVVEIDDFDMSEEECSTGFHFFCSLELAQNYNM